MRQQYRSRSWAKGCLQSIAGRLAELGFWRSRVQYSTVHSIPSKTNHLNKDLPGGGYVYTCLLGMVFFLLDVRAGLKWSLEKGGGWKLR
jgi:hypothetical protein